MYEDFTIELRVRQFVAEAIPLHTRHMRSVREIRSYVVLARTITRAFGDIDCNCVAQRVVRADM